jgi:hypothetical protein
MAQVILELQEKNDQQLKTFSAAHKAAMAGNPNYMTPSPSATVYDAAQLLFSQKVDAITTAETALAVLRAEKEAAKADLILQLTSRGSYVQAASGGNEAKIHSAGFDTKSAPTPTTSLPAPTNVSASGGDLEGELDGQWDAVPKAKTYVVQCRLHPDNAAPGPWEQAKITTRSRLTLEGLISGTVYAIRVQALGGNEVVGPWSDEAIGRAT